MTTSLTPFYDFDVVDAIDEDDVVDDVEAVDIVDDVDVVDDVIDDIDVPIEGDRRDVVAHVGRAAHL